MQNYHTPISKFLLSLGLLSVSPLGPIKYRGKLNFEKFYLFYYLFLFYLAISPFFPLLFFVVQDLFSVRKGCEN